MDDPGFEPSKDKIIFSSPKRSDRLWAQAASCEMSNEFFSRGQSGRGMNQTPHRQLKLRLKRMDP